MNRKLPSSLLETTWEQRSNALTHILTLPTTQPSLSSQFFVSSCIPCFINWDYPPIFCNKPKNQCLSLHWKWAFSLFLRKLANLGLPQTSWRSKCPFTQPPPLVLAKGAEPPPLKMGPEEKREIYRKILRRKRWVKKVPSIIPFLVPNLSLFLMLLYDPLPPKKP
ncbi:hypothetical protein AMTRI_Chr05g59250 [Amborella trichopoda]|uniref:Transmembrane protein n=1 Tax=Amborella trichopoda TaxID=13333 RepID=U5CQJ5_AMBTC|nr:uncharacterized protein LOC18443740 [Amborella trichopoda]ERN15451.1 hypothetical protein AMTR_s00036p00227170 [Amborella trichopoda]|eukprot:XP_006853984.1 uncharacterized protein LOC18443740 [Amborella trichopoda]